MSFLATTGNSETTTLGTDLLVERRPDPWGFEIAATYDRAEDANVKQSERAFLALRLNRALNDRWQLFGKLSGEKDEFAGFELRTLASAGATLHSLLGPRHILDFDFGLSWVDENRLEPEPDVSHVGGLLALNYQWQISEQASLEQRLSWFPNFDESGDWRLESATSIEAALSSRLALRLGYEIRYRNEPIGDLDDTDTTARVSLVLNF